MADEIRAALDKLADWSALWKNGAERTRTATLRVFRTYRPQIVRRLKEKLTGELLQVRTGRLRAAQDAEIIDEGLAIALRFGPLNAGEDLPYANIQEVGGDIFPVHSQVLTIPLPAALTPAGVPRFTARGAALEYESTFWARSRKGNLILFGVDDTGDDTTPDGDDLVPLFYGEEDHVTIEGTHYQETTRDEFEPLVFRDLSDALVALFGEPESSGSAGFEA